MENKIIWQKWVDPFGGDDLDTEQDLASGLYDDSEEDEHHKKEIAKVSKIRVMATPMGIIPITENTSSSKIFNFWIGHTNFNITKAVAKIIEETRGVESLDIFTRYRFRVAVGKAFEDSYVMREINDNVYAYIE